MGLGYLVELCVGSVSLFRYIINGRAGVYIIEILVCVLSEVEWRVSQAPLSTKIFFVLMRIKPSNPPCEPDIE